MPFGLQPTLEGSLLSLRPLREDDYEALYAVAKDPLIWEQHPAWDRYQEPVFQKLFHDGLASGGALVAIGKQSGAVIGSSRYHGYDESQSQIEIGWTFLARSHWGGAYNGEMKRLMLQHAFQFVENVIFAIGPENHRSRRAIEKIGGVLAGTRNDGAIEHVIYRIRARDFAPRP